MGIRMPDHPVALALIEAANRPIAAPSANRYTEVSPTTAQHVVTGLGGRIPYVLDGGATTVGIESTVLSLVDRIPTILRPGAVTAADIALEIGRVEVAAPQIPDDQSRPSPGLSRRHYAPAVPLEIVDAMPGGDVLGDRDVVIVRKSPGDTPARVVVLGDSAANWARELYALLHRFGAEDIDRIVVERPPESEEWRAIRDRLERAASFE
jgi:L-threonylcarbamoyladenylate synthase